MTTSPTQCGLIAVVGAPNAGKSSLVNALVGQHVAIVTAKRNTTRLVVRGVVTHGTAQLVLVDTPGLHTTASGFDRMLVQQARGALADADAIALVADANLLVKRGLSEVELDILAHEQPTVFVVNKIDQVTTRADILPVLEKLGTFPNIRAVALISATKKDGLDMLLRELTKLIPTGPWLFAAGQTTDLPLPIRLAEITRAQAMKVLHEELPYLLTVVPNGIEEAPDGAMLVHQRVVVARSTHKGMVVGKGGATLQRFGTAARKEMQVITGRGIRLNLHVEVDERWMERNELLRSIGLRE